MNCAEFAAILSAYANELRDLYAQSSTEDQLLDNPEARANWVTVRFTKLHPEFAGFRNLVIRTLLAMFSSPWTWLTVKFSPAGGATDQIVTALGKCKQTVRVLAYSFTSKPIIDALISAKRRGVDVQIVLDHSNTPSSKDSGGGPCAAAGIPVRVDAMHRIMHDKVLILDGQAVMTGSFNFSGAAETANAENSLSTWDAATAARYEADWQTHWDHSHPWGGTAHFAMTPPVLPEF